MLKRITIIKNLRDKGYSYQEIGVKFNLTRQRIHQLFNSKKLPATQYIQNRKLTGRDYIREKIRARDNYTCQSCNRKWIKGERRFDIHHIDCVKKKSKQYDNLEIEKDNMITLCHICHLHIEEHRLKMQKSALLT